VCVRARALVHSLTHTHKFRCLLFTKLYSQSCNNYDRLKTVKHCNIFYKIKCMFTVGLHNIGNMQLKITFFASVWCRNETYH